MAEPEAKTERPKAGQEKMTLADRLKVPASDRKRWEEELLPLARNPIPEPDPAKVTAAELQALKQLYPSIRKDWVDVKTVLDSIEQSTIVMRPDLITNIWIKLSAFLPRVHSYRHRVAGNHSPPHLELPDFLLEKAGFDLSGSMALSTAEKLLQMQYDVVEYFQEVQELKGKKPQDIEGLAHSNATYMVQRQISMSFIEACLDSSDKPKRGDDAPYADLLRAARLEPTAENIESAKLLVGFIAKGIPRLRARLAEQGRPLKNATIVEGLNNVTGLPELGGVAEKLVNSIRQNGRIPTAEEVSQILAETKKYPEQFLDAAFEPFGKNIPPDKKKEFHDDAMAVGRFFLAGTGNNVPLADMDRVIGYLTDNQKKLANDVRKHITDQKTVEKLLNSALVPSNESERTDSEKEAAKILSDVVLNQKISCKDAFEIHYALETAGPNILLGFKVIHILRTVENKKYRSLAEDFNTNFIVERAILGLYFQGVEGMMKKLSLSETQKRETRNVLLYFKDNAVDKFFGWLDFIRSLYKNYPKSMWGLTGGVGIALGARYLQRWRRSDIQKFVKADPEAIARKLGVEVAEVRELQATLREMLVDTSEAVTGSRFNPFVNWGMQGEMETVRRSSGPIRLFWILPFRKLELQEVFKKLKKKGESLANSMKYLHGLGTEQDVKEAARAAGWPAEEINRAYADESAARATRAAQEGRTAGDPSARGAGAIGAAGSAEASAEGGRRPGASEGEVDPDARGAGGRPRGKR